MSRIKAILTGIVVGVGVSVALAMGPQLPPPVLLSANSLDALFGELHRATSEGEADVIEARIWAIWSVSGRADVDSLMRLGVVAIAESRYEQARAHLDRVTDLAPGFAEGWNKRATVHYLLGEFDAALSDIDRTLALEPRHFGALSGRALVLLSLGDERSALDTFERVLALSPASVITRRHVERLRGRVGMQSV